MALPKYRPADPRRLGATTVADPAASLSAVAMREHRWERPRFLFTDPPSAFGTTNTLELPVEDANKLLLVLPPGRDANGDLYPVPDSGYMLYLPPASAAMVGSKIQITISFVPANQSNPIKLLVYSKPSRVGDTNTIGVAVTSFLQAAVIDYGGGTYNWIVTSDTTLAARVASLEAGGTPGAGTGTARDPYDVDTAKRKAVVDANAPAVAETDTAYYGKQFVDEVYGPGQPAYYKCMPSAPATTGGATVWKWFRIDIL